MNERDIVTHTYMKKKFGIISHGNFVPETIIIISFIYYT